MSKGLSVLEFTKIQFLGNWKRAVEASYANYIAEDEKGSTLSVVWQGETGIEVTYDFTIKCKDQVWVNWAENIVHIPALCLFTPKNGWG